MKILAIDTTTKFLCIGIYDGGKIYEYNLETGRKLSSLLVVTIKRILEALSWRAQDIDYFACGLGPGSFTGIRVGLAAIKGFAWSLNKPIIGVATLDVLAQNARCDNGFIMPVVDAKRSLIYCCVYKAKNGSLKRVTPYMLLSEKKLYCKAKINSMIFGDAVGLYKENILRHIKGAVILDKDYWYPCGRNMISAALEKIKEKRISRFGRIKPIYLYPKECQIRREK